MSTSGCNKEAAGTAIITTKGQKEAAFPRTLEALTGSRRLCSPLQQQLQGSVPPGTHFTGNSAKARPWMRRI